MIHLTQSQHWTYCLKKQSAPGRETVSPSDVRDELKELACNQLIGGTQDTAPFCPACYRAWKKDTQRPF